MAFRRESERDGEGFDRGTQRSRPLPRRCPGGEHRAGREPYGEAIPRPQRQGEFPDRARKFRRRRFSRPDVRAEAGGLKLVRERRRSDELVTPRRSLVVVRKTVKKERKDKHMLNARKSLAILALVGQTTLIATPAMAQPNDLLPKAEQEQPAITKQAAPANETPSQQKALKQQAPEEQAPEEQENADAPMKIFNAEGNEKASDTESASEA